MKSSSFKSIFSIFFSLVLLFASCQKPNLPEFKQMKDIQITSISAKEIVIKGKALINNASNITYQVTGGVYALSIEGLSFGQIEHELEASLLPNQESTIPLIIKLATKDLPKKGWMSRVLGIISSQQATVTLDGHFILNVKGANLPIPVSYSEKLNIADYAK